MLFFGGWAPANALFLSEVARQWRGHIGTATAVDTAAVHDPVTDPAPTRGGAHASAVKAIGDQRVVQHASSLRTANRGVDVSGSSVLLALINSVAFALLSTFQVGACAAVVVCHKRAGERWCVYGLSCNAVRPRPVCRPCACPFVGRRSCFRRQSTSVS